MTRGEIWTGASGTDFGGKPRPVLIIQNETFEALDSVIVCGLTTDPTDLPIFRIPVEPNDANGLKTASRVMIDKVFTVRKSKLRYRIGRLDAGIMLRVNRALALFLGLGG